MSQTPLVVKTSPPPVLYQVNLSCCFSSNGYAQRTQAVASALSTAGLPLLCATKPGLIRERLGEAGWDHPSSCVKQGIRYLHASTPCLLDLPREEYLAAATQHAAEIIKVFKPRAVLAASNWANARPAAAAARAAGLPFYYEVRGFWELSRAANDSNYATSEEYRRCLTEETALARSADKIFTLNRFMRDELIARGVEPAKILLVPNGFHTPVSTPAPTMTRQDLGIASKFLVGYIGSFNPYEGLDDLIAAIATARRQGVDVSLLLVGSSSPAGTFGGGMAPGHCPAGLHYRKVAEDHGVKDAVFLAGRVEGDEVARFYPLLDLVVIPRRPSRATELVSPLKPLEAAAHGKRVLMSDVAPLADLAHLSPGFLLFRKGDTDSLTDALITALHDAPPNPLPATLDHLTWDRCTAPLADILHRCAV